MCWWLSIFVILIGNIYKSKMHIIYIIEQKTFINKSEVFNTYITVAMCMWEKFIPSILLNMVSIPTLLNVHI